MSEAPVARAGPSETSLAAELQRKAIHLAFLAVPLAYHWGVPKSYVRDFLLGATVISIGVELLRLHEPRVRSFFRQFFGALVRRHERRALLGSTYMLIAGLLSVELFAPPIAAAALGTLVLGDAAASIVGRLWGRTRLFGSRKSLEGALACLVISFLFIWGVIRLPWPVALLGAAVGTLFENLPLPLDDNFRIPLSAGFAMKLFG